MAKTAQKILFAMVIFSAFLSLGVSDAPMLIDPESEIALATSELKNLHLKLVSAKEMAARLGLGPQTMAADRSFANAKQFYAHNEHLSTIRELNNYLNLSQVPDLKLYLEAQEMLGKSYEATGIPNKALRAYFRYLAAFMTAKEQNHQGLLNVLRRMIPLAAKDNGHNKELNELLASITSIEVPEDIKPAIEYFAAKAAINSNQRQQDSLTLNWLENAVTKGKDPTLKARAMYVRSLIALADKNYDQAEELLTQIIQLDVKDASENEASTSDLSRMALARIAVHRKKPELALKYYAMITEKSSESRSALFESVYVHLDIGQDGEARGKAVLFLARYPQDADAYQLRTLLAYLDLRAGDVSAAATGIEAADKTLKDMDKWLDKEFTGKNVVTHTQLINLIDLTSNQVAPTPSVRVGFELFGRLAELSRGLADIRGEIRNILYTVGRLNIETIRPQWVNRAEQLASISDEILKIGHRLAATERFLYQDRLDKVSLQQLSASEDRRTRLLTLPADSRRKMQYWASYANFMDLTTDLAAQHQKLEKAEAELAAAKYLAQTNKKTELTANYEKRVDDLDKTVKKLRESTAKALELVRSQKVESLLKESPHRAARKFMTQYAMALHQESEIIKPVRDETKTTVERLLADDGEKAWLTWQQVSKEAYDQIEGLDQEIKNDLGNLVGSLEKQEEEHDKLKENLEGLTRSLEAQMGRSLSYILSQYGNAIDSRRARHQKWRADLEWLSYKKTQTAGKAANDKFNLEKQILQDNLTDLQQGVLWKWPE